LSSRRWWLRILGKSVEKKKKGGRARCRPASARPKKKIGMRGQRRRFGKRLPSSAVGERVRIARKKRRRGVVCRHPPWKKRPSFYFCSGKRLRYDAKKPSEKKKGRKRERLRVSFRESDEKKISATSVGKGRGHRI